MLKRILLIITLCFIPFTSVLAEEASMSLENPEFSYPSSDSTAPPTIKATKNYVEIYNNLEPANFSYIHDIDPDQYYDIKDTTWAPYPLLRLNSYNDLEARREDHAVAARRHHRIQGP